MTQAPGAQTLKSGLHAPHIPAGSLPDGSDEQKPFLQGGLDPAEVGGEGSRLDTGRSGPRGDTHVAWTEEGTRGLQGSQGLGVSGSCCCRTSSTPETLGTTPMIRRLLFPARA